MLLHLSESADWLKMKNEGLALLGDAFDADRLVESDDIF